MFFIANWKMFGDFKSVNSIKKVIKLSKNKKYKKAQIVYCPPYTLINRILKLAKNSTIKVGAQNCHYSQNSGPFTGSVNSDLIKSSGAKYVIIGHSENRSNGENDHLINKKIKSALKNNLTVIFCIGESKIEKRNKKTNKVLKSQILKGLKDISLNNKIIIAYEPIWSIGTGVVPKNIELMKNIQFIKLIINQNFNFKKVKIIYGGSVSPKNIDHLNTITSLDGYLIGGASQSSKKLIDIVKKTFI